MNVLEVEDEPDARELVERVLAEAGCRVTSVPSAEAALAAIEAERPHLLISDIGLPDQDGDTLIQRVRALERGEARALPAIALTAFARSEDRTQRCGRATRRHRQARGPRRAARDRGELRADREPRSAARAQGRLGAERGGSGQEQLREHGEVDRLHEVDVEAGRERALAIAGQAIAVIATSVMRCGATARIRRATS